MHGARVPGPDGGATLAQRWSGGRRELQSLPSSVTDGALHAVSCPTDAAGTAVGAQMTDAATSATLVERFVG